MTGTETRPTSKKQALHHRSGLLLGALGDAFAVHGPPECHLGARDVDIGEVLA